MGNGGPEGDRTVAGRYRLGQHVGSGGMGTVWRARDELLRRSVAVKEVRIPEGMPAVEVDRLRERYLREARAAARLRHAGVVGVYDVIPEAGRVWIVMELVAANDLAKVIRAEGPMSPQRAARIGLQVLDALDAAHAAGVLHRDVKPANVLICDGDRAVLTDFGVASVAGDPALTRTGQLVGSPAYLSPERLTGMPAAPASDLWSLGCMLYAAVEGSPPYLRGDQFAVITAITLEPVPPPRRAGAIAPVLAGLLEKDPAVRWDAARTRAALARISAGYPAEAGPPGSAGFWGGPMKGTDGRPTVRLRRTDPTGDDRAGYDPATFDPPAYDHGAFDPAAYDQGAYNQGAYEQRAYERGAYEPAPVSGMPVSGTPAHGRLEVGGRAISATPVSGPPVSGAPVSGAPVSDAPVSGVPVSGMPVSGAPVSGSPAPVSGSPAPVSSFLAPVSGAPVGGVPGAVRPVSGVPVAGRPATGMLGAGIPVSGGPSGAAARGRSHAAASPLAPRREQYGTPAAISAPPATSPRASAGRDGEAVAAVTTVAAMPATGRGRAGGIAAKILVAIFIVVVAAGAGVALRISGLLPMVGGDSDRSSGPTNRDADTSRFTNEDVGYRLSYPSDWNHACPTAYADGRCYFDVLNGDAHTDDAALAKATYVLVIVGAAGGKGALPLLAAEERNHRGQFPMYRHRKLQVATFGAHEGALLEFTYLGRRFGLPTTVRIFRFVQDDRYYEVSLRGPIPQIPSFETGFTAIANSIRPTG